MNIVDQIIGPQDVDPEVEDLAADFVESFVGFFDWFDNWSKLDNRRAAVAAWLSGRQSSADPDEVVAAIDRMNLDHPTLPWQGSIV